jgi:undecaprenyl diphosphate synthase
MLASEGLGTQQMQPTNTDQLRGGTVAGNASKIITTHFDRSAYAASAGLDLQRLPRHVAIIMDGNGRWARSRGKPRTDGHAAGADAVACVVEECCRLGISYLTLYCLSSENWKRPRQEIDFLMLLLQHYLRQERPRIMEQNIRLTVIGRRQGLPASVQAAIEENVAATAHNSGLTLCLALNYGSRAEIVDAVRELARAVQQGKLAVEQIDESVFSAHLYTADMPDPDLLIRTAGEMRLSNFLLWQISYAELWVTPHYWPEFNAELFHAALRDYARRERRFGGLGTHTHTQQ